MDGQQPFYSLYLDSNQGFDQQIHPKSCLDAHAAINHWHGNLTLDRKLPHVQLAYQTLLIDGFQQPGPSAECTANAESTI
ncbi:MAG TPA: hypothetical protein VMF67_10980 [Rhizomicrobium sp.]|nr:hypothetical protein [Rhizomicrobium sp.]